MLKSYRGTQRRLSQPASHFRISIRRGAWGAEAVLLKMLDPAVRRPGPPRSQTVLMVADRKPRRRMRVAIGSWSFDLRLVPHGTEF